MSSPNLTNLGHRVSTRQLNWQQLVEQAWGAEFTAPDHGAYEWSNGRKFDSTDRGLTGLYGVDVTPPWEFDEYNMPRVPDMDTTLMVSDQDSTELLYLDPDTDTHACAYSSSAYPGINTPGCMVPASTGA
jgi:hypothetical protein